MMLAVFSYGGVDGTNGTGSALPLSVLSASEIDDVGLLILLWMREVLMPFWASFFAMTFAALLRLLFFALQLRGGTYNCDPLLRASRASVRGVSFAFLVTAWLLPSACAMHTGGLFDASTGQVWDGCGRSPLIIQRDPYADLIVENSAPAAPPQFEVPRPEFLEIEELEEFEDFLEEDVRQQRAAVRLLLFQRADRYISLWVDVNTSVDDVRMGVAATALHASDDFVVVEATPQLPDDVITMAVFPSWWRAADRVCVIFNHQAADGAPFLGSIPSRARLGDVYTAFGQAPPNGWAFYLQNSTEPLPRGDAFEVAEGSIIVLRPRHYQRVEMPTLAESLADLYWSRDVETHGLPRAPSPDGKRLILSAETACVISVDANITVPALNVAACRATGLDPALSYLVLCNGVMEQPAYQGVPYRTVVGVIPRSWITGMPRPTGVFLDTRDFGEEVAFHVFPYHEVCVEEIVTLLEVAVPPGYTAWISGTDGPADRDGYHRISQGLLITLWVESEPDEDDGQHSVAAGSHMALESASGRFFRVPELTAAVFMVQRKTTYVQVTMLPGDTASTFVRALQDVLYEGDQWHRLYAVCPQPQTGYVATVMDTTWTGLLGVVPVVIDATDIGDGIFATFLQREFCRDDISTLFGASWDDDFVLLAPTAGQSILGSQLYPAFKGMLIVALRAGTALPELQDLEMRLEHPHSWACEVTDAPVQDEPPLPQSTALLGWESGRRVLQLPAEGGWADLHQYVALHSQVRVEELRLTTPSRSFSDLAIRGRRVSGVLGMSFASTAASYGIFIDARDLGSAVTFVHVPNCTNNIQDVLELAGIRCFNGLPLRVRGAVAYTPSTGTVTVGHRTVLTIEVDVDFILGWLQGAHATVDDADGDDHEQASGSAGPGLPDGASAAGSAASTNSGGDRSRSPRRDGGGSRGTADVVLPIGDSSSGSELQFTWNPGYTYDDARDACRQEDTSVCRLGIATLLDAVPCAARDDVLSTTWEGLQKLFQAEFAPEDDVPSGSLPLPVEISLASALGPQLFDLSVESMPFPDCASAWRLLEPWKISVRRMISIPSHCIPILL